LISFAVLPDAGAAGAGAADSFTLFDKGVFSVTAAEAADIAMMHWQSCLQQSTEFVKEMG
jgi:hypothetical protein